MSNSSQADRAARPSYVSTGHLPEQELISKVVAEAYEEFKSGTEG